MGTLPAEQKLRHIFADPALGRQGLARTRFEVNVFQGVRHRRRRNGIFYRGTNRGDNRGAKFRSPRLPIF
jgi:hypothetical protein